MTSKVNISANLPIYIVQDDVIKSEVQEHVGDLRSTIIN
jgi:hypothetical protein